MKKWEILPKQDYHQWFPKTNKKKSARQPDADIKRDKLFITHNRFEALSSFVDEHAHANDGNNKEDTEMNEENEPQAYKENDTKATTSDRAR